MTIMQIECTVGCQLTEAVDASDTASAGGNAGTKLGEEGLKRRSERGVLAPQRVHHVLHGVEVHHLRRLWLPHRRLQQAYSVVSSHGK